MDGQNFLERNARTIFFKLEHNVDNGGFFYRSKPYTLYALYVTVVSLQLMYGSSGSSQHNRNTCTPA